MPSRRAEQIPPFLVMDVLERAQELDHEGHRVIHMEIGEPDFDTPPAALEAGIRALRDGRTHYTHSLGLPELRESIAGWQRRRYGIEVDAEQVIVTIGTSGAMQLIFTALLDPGDEGHPDRSALRMLPQLPSSRRRPTRLRSHFSGQRLPD